jgi:dGTP triphosphohydrolase
VLKRQQFGECQIIKNLFTLFLSICMEEDGKKFDNWAKILPAYCREEITKIRREKSLTKKNASRIVADTISYLSDDEAIKLYSRISGGNPGSIFDLLTT